MGVIRRKVPARYIPVHAHNVGKKEWIILLESGTIVDPSAEKLRVARATLERRVVTKYNILLRAQHFLVLEGLGLPRFRGEVRSWDQGITAEIIAVLPSSGGNRDRTALSVFRCHGDEMDQTSLVDVRTPIHPAHPPPIILHDHLWPRRVESGSHSVQVPLKASDTVPYYQR